MAWALALGGVYWSDVCWMWLEHGEEAGQNMVHGCGRYVLVWKEADRGREAWRQGMTASIDQAEAGRGGKSVPS